MKITDILSPDMVIADLKGTTKPDVLNELAKALAAKYTEIKLADLTAVLAERERLGSTAIGDGIAIPHGKLRGVTKIIGAFGRHRARSRFRFARRRTVATILRAGRARGFRQPASESTRARLAPAQGRIFSKPPARPPRTRTSCIR